LAAGGSKDAVARGVALDRAGPRAEFLARAEVALFAPVAATVRVAERGRVVVGVRVAVHRLRIAHVDDRVDGDEPAELGVVLAGAEVVQSGAVDRLVDKATSAHPGLDGAARLAEGQAPPPYHGLVRAGDLDLGRLVLIADDPGQPGRLAHRDGDTQVLVVARANRGATAGRCEDLRAVVQVQCRPGRGSADEAIAVGVV